MSPAEYVRAIEHHICQKNDGHLIRIVGPSFDVVCRWERDGVPLKVALRGIDRYFERYYRQGARRRPVRVEFCDTDVLEVFDEWRRAVGIAARGAGESTPRFGDAAPPAAPGGALEDAATGDRHSPSLPAHLERVLLKLSSARALGRLGADMDGLLDRVADELDRSRTQARGLRGEPRRALIQRLADIDRALLDAALAALSDGERAALAGEADAELAGYRVRMAPEAYVRAHQRLIDHLVRERHGLPVVSFA